MVDLLDLLRERADRRMASEIDGKPVAATVAHVRNRLAALLSNEVLPHGDVAYYQLGFRTGYIADELAQLGFKLPAIDPMNPRGSAVAWLRFLDRVEPVLREADTMLDSVVEAWH